LLSKKCYSGYKKYHQKIVRENMQSHKNKIYLRNLVENYRSEIVCSIKEILSKKYTRKIIDFKMRNASKKFGARNIF
tara:strand:+ start:688 stop:918 length:231 start_codon:yes stop_codon:yes gene_type:complete